MQNPKPITSETYTDRQRSDCPLNENCLSECLVHNVVVNTSTTRSYYSASVKSFKEGYNNNKSTFRNKLLRFLITSGN